MGSLLNSCNLSAKSKTKFKSRSKSKTKFKSKSKSRYSDSSKTVANAEPKLMKFAKAQLKVRFLVRHEHFYDGIPDYSVISTEDNSFRVLDADDDDLPFNLLPLFRAINFSNLPTHDVLRCCGSWIWLQFQQFPSPPQDLLWDMETDTCRSLCFPSTFPCINGSVWACGFGFDPSSRHYKLVRYWKDDIEDKYAEVFSLGTGSWKAVHYPFDFTVRPDTYSSIHINGFYYWIARAGARFHGSFAIMSFDFAKDRFRALIPLPYDDLSVVLVEFQGSLAAIYFDSKDNINPFIFKIWGWNARGRFWSIVSIFDIPAAAAPRAVWNLYNNDKLFLEDSKGDLLLYDHATRRLENLRIPIDRRGFSRFFPYFKSSIY